VTAQRSPGMSTYLVLLGLAIEPAAALAAGAKLTKALSSVKQPVVVHLYDHKPTELASYAIDDVSAACRNSGAAAVLVAPELVGAIAEEQDSHRGDYPGPVPIIVDCSLNNLPAVDEIAAKGAAAIGIRYYEGDWPEADALEEALQAAIASASESGLASVLLAEFGADGAEGLPGAGGLASRVGAAAGLVRLGCTPEADASAIELGCWHGGDKDLTWLRDAGFGALVIKDACGGNMALGARESSPSLAAQRVTALVKRTQSKSSRTFGGTAMFGSTASLDAAPSEGSLDSYFDRA